MDADSLAALDEKMGQLERKMKAYENVFRDRGFTPTVWPVVGKLESGFGGRSNPFGGRSYEFHSGQDIDAPSGEPVVAGASGKVTFYWLAKWIWTTRSDRPRWRSDYSLWPLVAH